MLIYDIETTCLNPFESESARVTMIGVLEPSGRTRIFTAPDEAEMLKQFWDYARKHELDEWVGFNNRDFDAKYLLKRSIIKNVKPCRRFFSKQIDLRLAIDPNRLAKGSLGQINKLMNGDHKYNNMANKDASSLWFEGRTEELRLYLEHDLKLTKNLYDRLRSIGWLV